MKGKIIAMTVQTVWGIRIGKYEIKIDKITKEYKTVKEILEDRLIGGRDED